MLKKSPILFALAVLVLAVGWPSPVQAHCKGKHAPPHPHCDDDGTPSGSTYDVTMTGDLFFIELLTDHGGTEPIPEVAYVGTDGGGRSKPVNIGFQDIKIDMSFFFDKFDDQPEQPESQRGKACFEPAPVVGMNTIAITISQEKGGSPSLHYWFTAVGADKETVINYLLELFDDTAGAMFMGEWRPAPDETSPIPTTATFTGWEMSMNSGGKKKYGRKDLSARPYQVKLVRV